MRKLIQPILNESYTKNLIEAGVDEVGRGCLAGPVVAAAVILPRNHGIIGMADSKKLSAQARKNLLVQIQEKAIEYQIGVVPPKRIDEINILNASFEAMHSALEQLDSAPELILVDGNRFVPFKNIPFECIVKGDSKFSAIAAASIIAKEFRDDLMYRLADEFPQYGWHTNVGYPTKAHKLALAQFGETKHHRKSFKWKPVEKS